MTGGDGAALLVIDMLNPYEHDEAEQLASHVAGAIDGIGSLIDRAGDAGVPVVYVNDNYGDWNSSAAELTATAIKGRHPELVEPIVPPEGASFVVKARHSVFYQTPVEYLLDQMNVGRLVLSGQVTEQCILYSALDAYVRHFDVVVPTDGVAAIHEDLADAAMRMMERNMRAKLCPAAECDFWHRSREERISDT